MFQRLAACVFVVIISRTYGQFQLSFGTPTPPGPLTYDPNCKDIRSDCHDYPDSSCQDPYRQWAKDNCPNRCGICLGPTTAPPPCADALSNCKNYDKSICTNTDYKNWATKNCRLFCARNCPSCGFCPPGAVVKEATTTISPANCVDKVDCRLYGPNACSGKFKDWAHDNCPLHCKFCTGLPTAPTVCTDKIPNCKLYAADTCTNPRYNLWVEDNCNKYCGKCAGVSTIAYNAPPSPPAPGKRSAEKRQFHASHHHPTKCWDSGMNDPDCSTSSPPVLSTGNQPIDSSTQDFPGSEYGPNHKSPDDWDHKNNTSGKATTKKPDGKSTKPPVEPPTVSMMTATKVSTGPTVSSGTENITDSTMTPSPSPVNTNTTNNGSTGATMTPTNTNTTNIVSNGSTVTPPTSQSPASVNTTINTNMPSTTNTTVSTNTTGTTQVPSVANKTDAVPPKLSTESTSESSTSSTPSTTPTTTQSTTPTTTSAPCVDTISNCAAYGIKNCNFTVYVPYMKSHCASFCNFCDDYTKCTDRIPNCKEFDDGRICTDPTLYGWASKNCYLYCGFYPCKGLAVATTEVATTTTTPKPTTTLPFNCTDNLPNCVYYEDDKCVGIYSAWARKNCAKRCGYCKDPLPCEDKNQFCDRYPADTCVKPEFRGWARDQCRKFCGLCGLPTQTATSQTGATNTPGTAPTGTPATPAPPVTSVAPALASTQSAQKIIG